MVTDLVAAALAVCVFVAPVVVLSPVVDRLFESPHLRAMARRLFRIDARATLADLPARRSGGAS